MMAPLASPPPPRGPQLGPGPDILACDELKRAYLPTILFAGAHKHMHNGEIMESSLIVCVELSGGEGGERGWGDIGVRVPH